MAKNVIKKNIKIKKKITIKIFLLQIHKKKIRKIINKIIKPADSDYPNTFIDTNIKMNDRYEQCN